jgi:hypothetical protein
MRWHYAVGVTAKGAAVVCSWKDDPAGQGYRFSVYPSLEQAAADDRVSYAAGKALEALGVPVEELDI